MELSCGPLEQFWEQPGTPNGVDAGVLFSGICATSAGGASGEHFGTLRVIFSELGASYWLAAGAIFSAAGDVSLRRSDIEPRVLDVISRMLGVGAWIWDWILDARQPADLVWTSH